MASIRWDLGAFEQLRRSPEIQAALQGEVDRVLGVVGDGYEGGVEEGATRSRGYVVTTTAEAIIRESTSHDLLRALGGGG